MKRASRPIITVLSVSAVLLAGCGGGGSSSSSSTGSKAPLLSPSSPQVKAAVDECKAIVAAQTKLSASAREKLETACSKAGKGDTEAVKQASREVCEEVIAHSPLPAAAKEQAAANCKKD